MKEKRDKISDAAVERFLQSYRDETLEIEFSEGVMKTAMKGKPKVMIRKLTSGWKRLSVAASIVAFTIGIILSNQTFGSNMDSSSESYAFADQGLYSYILEVEE